MDKKHCVLRREGDHHGLKCLQKFKRRNYSNRALDGRSDLEREGIPGRQNHRIGGRYKSLWSINDKRSLFGD